MMTQTVDLIELLDLNDMTALKYEGSTPLPADWSIVNWKYLVFHEAHRIQGGYQTVETTKAVNDDFTDDSLLLAIADRISNDARSHEIESFAIYALSVRGYRDHCIESKRSAYEILSIFLPNSATCRRLGVELGIITQ